MSNVGMTNNGRDSSTPQPVSQIEAPEGIIIPPPDIRAIIEKTAGYVSRNGQAFESRIREKEKENNRFSFLNTSDPYYPFYEWRLDEFREGRAGNESAQSATATKTNGSSASISSISTVDKSNKAAAPSAYEFAVTMPPISALDLDVIRLTSLFAAENGKPFVNQLSQREERNYQFDFLRSNHSLYALFNKLTEQYRKVLNPSKSIRERLESNLKNKYAVLDSARYRAEWKKQKEEAGKAAAEEAEAERIAFAQIDWHDFVVVETINFSKADNDVELPPPMSLTQLENASLEQKQMLSLLHESEEIAQASIENSDPVPTLPPPPGVQYVPVPTVPHPPSAASEETGPPTDADENPRIRELQANFQRQRNAEVASLQSPGLQNIKILPQGSTRRSLQAARITVQECPLCHEPIPAAEFDEHMRIELLDPRWKEEKAKNEARQAISNLAFNEVTQNFKRLASARTDLFDSQGNSLTPEEASRIKSRKI
ncbi:Pre-mRNA splicing factor PRP21 like protein-domain-containing protein [Lipomyces oligophaga]|uniref:Pre-mRNA splicing factor PRP21 like protein-domain-containing protein n=1 Tax=Lipomyces oligophaga TaxID=45792 RepID=UPI0034CF802E